MRAGPDAARDERGGPWPFWSGTRGAVRARPEPRIGPGTAVPNAPSQEPRAIALYEPNSADFSPNDAHLRRICHAERDGCFTPPPHDADSVTTSGALGVRETGATSRVRDAAARRRPLITQAFRAFSVRSKRRGKPESKRHTRARRIWCVRSAAQAEPGGCGEPRHRDGARRLEGRHGRLAGAPD